MNKLSKLKRDLTFALMVIDFMPFMFNLFLLAGYLYTVKVSFIIIY